MIIKYPLDLTSTAATNLITQEVHTVEAAKHRGFALNYGAFYTKSLVVRNKATGDNLLPNIDYICLHLYEQASKYSGEEVCAAVLIINDTIVGDLEVDYQCVGGEFVFCVPVITQLIEALQLDNRTIAWGDIIGVLDEFPPAPHMHDVDDLYGFEYLIDSMNKLVSAIKYGDSYDHQQLLNKINALSRSLGDSLNDLTARLELHVNDAGNPHRVTKAQVGLSEVANFPITDAPGDSSEQYASAKAVFNALNQAKKITDIVISANTTLEVNQRYLVISDAVLRIPDPNDPTLPLGARIEIRKLTTVIPTLSSPNGLMVTVNGEGYEVSYDINTDISLILNHTTMKWEISAAGFIS